MNFYLKKSRISKLLLPITTLIVLVFIINQAQAGAEATTLKASESAVYYDKNTGLEWLTGPDKATSWYDAKRWIENLTVPGGGWRMPTREELRNLYKKGTGERNMTPLLKTTGWYVWSGEIKGSLSAWYFSFGYGDEFWGSLDVSYGYGRGFAVRLRR
jgi:hypothetical protein